MTISFKPGTTAPKPSPQELHSFEEYYKLRLPPSYVTMLEHGNGGVPITNCFMQGTRKRLIERMLSIVDGDPKERGIHGVYAVEVVEAQLGERLVDGEAVERVNVIPIAALFAGDMVCLDFRRGPQNPTVAVWDHESSRAFAPALETVATSFEAFLQMLQAPESGTG
jgi:hypothetical protein